MAQREGFKIIEVVEGRAYEERHFETGEPSVRWDYYVRIEALDGKDYVHPKTFRWRRDAEAFLTKVEARGTVDLSHWVEQEPRLSLEERFDIYAQNEQEVRWGLRDETDLYHGV